MDLHPLPRFRAYLGASTPWLGGSAAPQPTTRRKGEDLAGWAIPFLFRSAWEGSDIRPKESRPLPFPLLGNRRCLCKHTVSLHDRSLLGDTSRLQGKYSANPLPLQKKQYPPEKS